MKPQNSQTRQEELGRTQEREQEQEQEHEHEREQEQEREPEQEPEAVVVDGADVADPAQHQSHREELDYRRGQEPKPVGADEEQRRWTRNEALMQRDDQEEEEGPPRATTQDYWLPRLNAKGEVYGPQSQTTQHPESELVIPRTGQLQT